MYLKHMCFPKRRARTFNAVCLLPCLRSQKVLVHMETIRLPKRQHTWYC